jgi:hypothetical protein
LLGQHQDLDPARAAFVSLRAKYPAKIMLRQRAQRSAAAMPPDDAGAPPPDKRPQDPHSTAAI